MVLSFLRVTDLTFEGIVIILTEEVSDQSIVIDDIGMLISVCSVQLSKETIHCFGIELEVSLHLLHPYLVHAVKVITNYISYFEVHQRVLLIKVYFDDVSDEQQRQLDPLALKILLEVRSDISCLLDVIIQTGIGHFPLHLLQSRPQKQYLQFVHHHYLDHL
jgi:hypothetical protein